MLIDGNPKNNPSPNSVSISFRVTVYSLFTVLFVEHLWNVDGRSTAWLRNKWAGWNKSPGKNGVKSGWLGIGRFHTLYMYDAMDEQNQWLTITSNFPDHRGNYNHQQYGKGASSTGTICRWKNANFGPTSQHRLATTCNYIISFEVCVCIYIYILYI